MHDQRPGLLFNRKAEPDQDRENREDQAAAQIEQQADDDRGGQQRNHERAGKTAPQKGNGQGHQPGCQGQQPAGNHYLAPEGEPAEKRIDQRHDQDAGAGFQLANGKERHKNELADQQQQDKVIPHPVKHACLGGFVFLTWKYGRCQPFSNAHEHLDCLALPSSEQVWTGGNSTATKNLPSLHQGGGHFPRYKLRINYTLLGILNRRPDNFVGNQAGMIFPAKTCPECLNQAGYARPSRRPSGRTTKDTL